MTARPLRLLGLSGSLRQASLNLGLLRAFGRALPDGVALTVFERLGAIPLFDEDLEQTGRPRAAQELVDAIAACDGLVLATPEYNHSYSAALKCGLEWVSRPPATTPLRGKPVALMGASPTGNGTMRAQHHLRQVLFPTGALVMGAPELAVPRAPALFDAGELADAETLQQVERHAHAFVAWIRRLG